MTMEFVWNDGGRAACGFVGLAGDCVTRAISIATGAVYRDVYQELGTASEHSPRDGVANSFTADYLKQRGWQCCDSQGDRAFDSSELPKGVVIAQVGKRDEPSRHMCTVIDHVVHDTWNPADDEDYFLKSFWTSSAVATATSGLIPTAVRRGGQEQELTQQAFEKILRRLRALDNTASNGASTEGEKHNALRMMQSLMLRHNLTREDIVDEDNVESVQFTRMACPVNGRRACIWESMLAAYVTQYIFTSVQWYRGTRGHRTLYWFYGPLNDVQNAIALFRELLLTIATAAHLQYGGHARGSGASYAEGYVAGLPRSADEAAQTESVGKDRSSDPLDAAEHGQGGLIHTRTLALQDAAREWLVVECGIRLTTSRGRGRYLHDDAAASRGKQHGAKHELNVPGRRRRIAQQ
ncbi:MAG: DUF2786 domain-containing protein [Planctomycetales bacterium]|nr:DUF2786 domain-containing protein [Planctomycetales bacterium]